MEARVRSRDREHSLFVALCDVAEGGAAVGVVEEGAAPKLMLMLGSKARKPSCQSFILNTSFWKYAHKGK